MRRSNRLLSTANFGQLKVTASDAATGDFFGYSVAIDGDTVVIGAYGAGTGGAVYVLRTSDGGATYAQVAKLTASDAAADDNFGVSVAIDGDTIVVGASGDDDASSCANWPDDACNSGSVYVFRTTNDWATHTEKKLTATDAAAGDNFGFSVAIAGGTVVVGAYTDGYGDAGYGSGSVYIFHTSDGGATYGQVVKLTAADGAGNEYFGYSVAIDGDTIVIGAYNDGDGGYGSGSVHIFRTTDGGATYGQVAKLTASDAAASDYFGWSVAIAGGTIVIGAYADDDGGYRSGSAYVFRTTDGGATYGQVAKLTASDAAAGDYFGHSVAIDGNTVAVGAHEWGNDGPGAAYVFSLPALDENSALGSDSATRAGGTLATALLAFAATALAL